MFLRTLQKDCSEFRSSKLTDPRSVAVCQVYTCSYIYSIQIPSHVSKRADTTLWDILLTNSCGKFAKFSLPSIMKEREEGGGEEGGALGRAASRFQEFALVAIPEFHLLHNRDRCVLIHRGCNSLSVRNHWQRHRILPVRTIYVSLYSWTMPRPSPPLPPPQDESTEYSLPYSRFTGPFTRLCSLQSSVSRRPFRRNR